MEHKSYQPKGYISDIRGKPRKERTTADFFIHKESDTPSRTQSNQFLLPESLVASDQKAKIIVLFIFFACYSILFALTTFNHCNLNSLIICGITIGVFLFMLLIQIFFPNKQLNEVFIALTQHILIALLITFMTTNGQCENEGVWNHEVETTKCIIISFLISHYINCYLLTHKIKFKIVILLINVYISVFLSVAKNMFYESAVVLISSFFLFANGHKEDTMWNDFVNENQIMNSNMAFYRKIIENINIGYCIINDKFHVEYSNKYFSQHFSHITKYVPKVNKPHNATKNFSHGNNTTLFNYVCENNENLFLNTNKNFNTLQKEDEECLILECENLMQKKNHHDNDNTHEESKQYLTLKEVLHSIIEVKDIQLDSNYIYLNKFKCKVRSSSSSLKNQNEVYEVYIRSNSLYKDSYELLFLNVTESIKLEKMKAEKKYKNLLLAKISHEFKAPIMYIQNTIDAVLEGENRNPDKSPLSYYNNGNIKLESFIKIKYLTEILLLLILDLSEYVNNEQKPSQKTLNSNQSIMEFSLLKEYLKNISNSLMLIHNKRLKMRIIHEDFLENARFTTDEKRIKQVLANLISNAIKNTIEGEINIIIKLNYNKKKIVNSYRDFSSLPKHVLSKYGSADLTRKRNSVQVLSTEYANSFGEFHYEGFSIAIEDTGPGIEEDLLQMINTNFEDVEIHQRHDSLPHSNNNPSEEYGATKGMGLGLLICKKLCLEMGIKIHCEVLKEEADQSFSTRSIPLLDIPERSRVLGTKFTLTFHNEVNLATCLASNTRTSIENDITLNIAEKQLVKYESDSSVDDCVKNVFLDVNSDRTEKMKVSSHSVQKVEMENPNISEDFYKPPNTQFEISSFDTSNHLLPNVKLPRLVSRQCSLNSNSILKKLNNNLSESLEMKITSVPNLNDVYKNRKIGLQSSIILERGREENMESPQKNFNRSDSNEVIRPLNQEIVSLKSDLTKDKHSFNISNIIAEQYLSANNLHRMVNLGESKKSTSRLLKYNSSTSLSNTRTKRSVKSKLFSVEEYTNNLTDSESNRSNTSVKLNLSTCPEAKILIVDDNKNNQDAIEKLVKKYFNKKCKKRMSNFNSENNKELKKESNSNLQTPTPNNQTHTITSAKPKHPEIKKLSDGIELVYEIYKEIITYGKNVTKIIFSDEMMVYMNGSESFTIINKILTEKGMNMIPFVICSAFSNESHFEKMKSLNIEYVYEKPLSLGNVEFILDNFMKCSGV